MIKHMMYNNEIMNRENERPLGLNGIIYGKFAFTNADDMGIHRFCGKEVMVNLAENRVYDRNGVYQYFQFSQIMDFKTDRKGVYIFTKNSLYVFEK